VAQFRLGGLGQVHQQHALVLAAHRQQLAVVAQRQRAHRQRAARGQAAQLARRVVEQAHAAVLAGGGEEAAARRGSHRRHLRVVHAHAPLAPHRLQRLRLAQQQQAVRAAADEVLNRLAALRPDRAHVGQRRVARQVGQLEAVVRQEVARHGA